MNNNFTPYEEALELKELGFNEPCLALYLDNDKKTMTRSMERADTNSWLKEHYKGYGDSITAPLYQQAFKFLREKLINKIVVSERGDYIDGNFTLLPLIFLNKYEIRVMAESVSYYIDETWGRNIPFYKEPLHRFTESAPTYDDAQLACLKRMIQIVKNK